MKRRIMALMLGAVICVTGTACGSSKTESANTESTTEVSSTETTVEEETVTDENTKEKVPAIEGTWQTASMVPGENDEVQPEYYVQFTDSEIQYGHMNDNEFTLDHSDAISSIETTANGGYKVQAESSNGVQYTFCSNEDDVNILEYYETWNEDEFSEKYSGGASLSKYDESVMTSASSEDDQEVADADEESAESSEEGKYVVFTDASNAEVEEYAQKVVSAVLAKDWDTVGDMIQYPIGSEESGNLCNNKEEFLAYADSTGFSDEALTSLGSWDISDLWANWQGACIDDGNIWFRDIDVEKKDFKIVALFDLREAEIE